MPKSKAHQAVEKFYKDVKGLDYKYGYQQEHLAGRAAFALKQNSEPYWLKMRTIQILPHKKRNKN